MYATGYRAEFAFVDQRQLNWNAERDCPGLYLHVFHPSYDTLFVAGLIQPDSGQFGLVHWQMRAAARYARAALTGHGSAERLRSRKRNPADDLGGGVSYLDSPRHYFEVEHWSYQRKLQRWARALAT